MGSIEAAFISLARYIRDHFPDLNWMPLWYGGIPYPDSYPPLLHMMVAAVSGFGRISPGLAYHAVTATIYCLAPVALFWAACRLGADRRAAFLAALGYSLVAPSAWLVKVLRFDIGGRWAPARLDAMVRYGEGPHITSLFFLPLAIGAVYVALERRRPVNFVMAALAMAAVVLSNWIGAFALALVAGAYLLAGVGGSWRLAPLAAYAYAIALPFVTPSTVATIQANAPIVAGGFKANHLLEAIFAVTVFAAAWAARRWIADSRVRFAIVLAWMTSAITLTAYWFKLWIIPQPERYHLEMDLALWLAVAVVVRFGKGRRAQLTFAALIALSVPIAVHQYRRAHDIEAPIAIRSTVEYEMSDWLGSHMHGRRVFAPGTTGYWMNAFSDTPMLVGGFDNGIRNTFLQEIIYQIYAGDRQDVMIGWLKAFGLDAVIGGNAQSREVYHPYSHPEKFEGMRVLWRDGPDAIYAVPRPRPSLAYAMPVANLVTRRPPAYSIETIQSYLRAIDDVSLPPVSFQWLGTGSAIMTAVLRADHILSVQISYDKGWKASVNGEPRRVWGDKLGQLVVEPRCDGACRVQLDYDGGGAEMLLARWISAAALIGGLVWILWQKYSGSMKTS